MSPTHSFSLPYPRGRSPAIIALEQRPFPQNAHTSRRGQIPNRPRAGSPGAISAVVACASVRPRQHQSTAPARPAGDRVPGDHPARSPGPIRLAPHAGAARPHLPGARLRVLALCAGSVVSSWSGSPADGLIQWFDSLMGCQ